MVKTNQSNQVRIIAGLWRGRKIIFPSVENLRPTPDRVRETVFNWLTPYLHDANCLDLFAGSGILGIEALSRGAASVTFVEQNKKAIKIIQQNLQSLSSQKNFTMIQQDALQFLQQSPSSKFNIVFLDPPYQSNLLTTCWQLLQKHDYLQKNAFIYFEHHTHTVLSSLPTTWQIHRQKKAGQVFYFLCTYSC